MVQVSICIATYRRPQGLRRLLEGLRRLRFERIEPPEIEVLVVDNEARQQGARVCADAALGFPWRLRPLEESRQGITFARNRGLRNVGRDADFVAFIDDDEEPEPTWLETLLLVQGAHAADVVTGPVLPRFESEAPAWVVRGGFFAPRQHVDGQKLDVAFTNNVLMRASVPDALGSGFDDRFALTGGEDTEFFMRVRRAGFLIVWAAEARVHESIPASRTTVGWVLRRGYREWGSHSRCESMHYPSPHVRLSRIAKAMALIGFGTASAPFTALAGRRHLVRSLLRVSRGLGSLAGLVGRHYAEYESSS